MKRYLVEHMQGIAVIDEKCVERHENVKAKDGHAAIRQVARGIEKWKTVESEFVSTIENSDAQNASGIYCDYWIAEEVES